MISNVDALEFSLHRIKNIAPTVIDGFKGENTKIRIILGSFYDIKAKDYDIMFMSQAFHHADNPLKLLYECDKSLKSKGAIILIGEHLINKVTYAKRVIKNFIKTRKFKTNFYILFKPDDVSGDHYYKLSDYYFMFQSLNYTVQHFPSGTKGNMVILAVKN